MGIAGVCDDGAFPGVFDRVRTPATADVQCLHVVRFGLPSVDENARFSMCVFGIKVAGYAREVGGTRTKKYMWMLILEGCVLLV